MGSISEDKPWDARLAYLLVAPLKDSAVTPNHLTTLRLLTGLAAAAAFAAGGYLWSNIGAVSFILSHFLDHTDGELARLSGRMSRFGHVYDLVADAAVNTLLFVGIGIGLARGELGIWAPVLGVLAGGAVAAIFHMRAYIEGALDRAAARQPHTGGFEIEDILYLLPLVTLSDTLLPFLILASIGAPLFSLGVLRDYRKLKQRA
jgi:phosphatidylglycerophosphate synthase